MTRLRYIGLNLAGNVCGESHPGAKLTWHDVDLIRELRSDGMKLKDIAQKFEVSLGCVNDIVRFRTWAERPVYSRCRRVDCARSP